MVEVLVTVVAGGREANPIAKVYRFEFDTEENVAGFIEKSSGKGYIKGLKAAEQLRPRGG
jgi:hypothetical protein